MIYNEGISFFPLKDFHRPARSTEAVLWSTVSITVIYSRIEMFF